MYNLFNHSYAYFTFLSYGLCEKCVLSAERPKPPSMTSNCHHLVKFVMIFGYFCSVEIEAHLVISSNPWLLKLIRNVVLRLYVQARDKNVKYSNFASLFLDAYPNVFKSCFVSSFF